jgi:transaldolase
MLGGGARGTHHFTEMVGGAIHLTINWNTAEELLDSDPPVVPRIGAETPGSIIDELCYKLPDFRRAFLEEGLAREDFKDYGPLQYFRSMFVQGWDVLLRNIRERRQRSSAYASSV